MVAITYNSPVRSLEEQIKAAILELGAVRYVPIKDEQGFFIIKLPGIQLEYGQDLGESLMDSMFPWLANSGGSAFTIPDAPINFCYVVHKLDKGQYGKPISRKSSDVIVTKSSLSKAGFKSDVFDIFVQQKGVWEEEIVKVISSTEVHVKLDLLGQDKAMWLEIFHGQGEKIFDFLHRSSRGEVDDIYLGKYVKLIQKAPCEMPLESMFTARFKLVNERYYGWGSEDDRESTKLKYTEVDYLIPIAGTKFPKYWKPINDLLRDVDLLRDGRGKNRKPDKATEAITTFIKQELKANKGKRLTAITLKNKYDKQLRKEFIPYDDDASMTEEEAKIAGEKIKKKTRHLETFRRTLNALQNCTKK